jgi:hypothetical protein
LFFFRPFLSRRQHSSFLDSTSQKHGVHIGIPSPSFQTIITTGKIPCGPITNSGRSGRILSFARSSRSRAQSQINHHPLSLARNAREVMFGALARQRACRAAPTTLLSRGALLPGVCLSASLLFTPAQVLLLLLLLLLPGSVFGQLQRQQQVILVPHQRNPAVAEPLHIAHHPFPSPIYTILHHSSARNKRVHTPKHILHLFILHPYPPPTSQSFTKEIYLVTSNPGRACRAALSTVS